MVYTEMSINPSPLALAKCQGGEIAWKGHQKLMSWMGGLAGLSFAPCPSTAHDRDPPQVDSVPRSLTPRVQPPEALAWLPSSPNTAQVA